MHNTQPSRAEHGGVDVLDGGVGILSKVPLAYEIKKDVQNTEKSHLIQSLRLLVAVLPACWSLMQIMVGGRVQGPEAEIVSNSGPIDFLRRVESNLLGTL